MIFVYFLIHVEFDGSKEKFTNFNAQRAAAYHALSPEAKSELQVRASNLNSEVQMGHQLLETDRAAKTAELLKNLDRVVSVPSVKGIRTTDITFLITCI